MTSRLLTAPTLNENIHIFTNGRKSWGDPGHRVIDHICIDLLFWELGLLSASWLQELQQARSSAARRYLSLCTALYDIAIPIRTTCTRPWTRTMLTTVYHTGTTLTEPRLLELHCKLPYQAPGLCPHCHWLALAKVLNQVQALPLGLIRLGDFFCKVDKSWFFSAKNINLHIRLRIRIGCCFS